jgi:hypothetical protein
MSNKTQSELVNGEFECNVEWVYAHQPKERYRAKNGEKDFLVTCILDTPELKKKMEGLLEAHNVSLQVINPGTRALVDRIRPDKTGKDVLTIKRPEFNSRGKRASIKVTDAAGNDIPSNIGIGAGSRAIVHFYVYQGQNGGVMQLSGLQILDLVPIEKKSSNTFKAKEGFSINDLAAEDAQATYAAHSFSQDTTI